MFGKVEEGSLESSLCLQSKIPKISLKKNDMVVVCRFLCYLTKPYSAIYIDITIFCIQKNIKKVSIHRIFCIKISFATIICNMDMNFWDDFLKILPTAFNPFSKSALKKGFFVKNGSALCVIMIKIHNSYIRVVSG